MRFVKKITNHRGLLFSLLLVIFLVTYVIIPYFVSSSSGVLSLEFYGAIRDVFPSMLLANGFYNILFFKVRTTKNTWKDIFNDTILRTILGVFVYFVVTLIYSLFIRPIDNIVIIALGLLLPGSYMISRVCNNRFIHQSTSWQAILSDSLFRSALFVLMMIIYFSYAMSQVT